MPILGCPHCGYPVSVDDKVTALLCSHCGRFFSKDDSIEPSYKMAKKSSIAVHDSLVHDRAVFRESYEQMADDAASGKAREKGGSYYRNQYRFKDRFRR